MDVCGKLRSVLKTRKVGHAGTLDPMATGVLPVFVGQATRAVSFAETGDKEYVAGLHLGCVTNTQDTSGDVLEQRPVHVTRQELEAFHHRLLADYRRRLSGDTPVLHRMRELWNYLSGSFDGAERELKAIRKARTLAEYQAAAQRLLGDCPLRENAVIET